MGAAAWEETSFRVRNDDGDEAGATWRQLINVADTVPVDTNFRVRFGVTVTGMDSSVIGQLQYNLAGAGFNNVNATSSVVQSVASPNEADGATITEQLSQSKTFVANASPNGLFDEVDGVVASQAITTTQETEMEFCITIISGDVTNGQTIELRVIDNASAFATYPSPHLVITVSEDGIGTENEWLASQGSQIQSPHMGFQETDASRHSGGGNQVGPFDDGFINPQSNNPLPHWFLHDPINMGHQTEEDIAAPPVLTYLPPQGFDPLPQWTLKYTWAYSFKIIHLDETPDIPPQNFDPFREWYIQHPIILQHEVLEDLEAPAEVVFIPPQNLDPLGEWYVEARTSVTQELLEPSPLLTDIAPQNFDPLIEWYFQFPTLVDHEFLSGTVPPEGPPPQNFDPFVEWYFQNPIHHDPETLEVIVPFVHPQIVDPLPQWYFAAPIQVDYEFLRDIIAPLPVPPQNFDPFREWYFQEPIASVHQTEEDFTAVPLLTEIAPQNFDPLPEWYLVNPIEVDHEFPADIVTPPFIPPQNFDPLGEWYFRNFIQVGHETLEDFIVPPVLIDIQPQNFDPLNEWHVRDAIHVNHEIITPTPLLTDIAPQNLDPLPQWYVENPTQVNHEFLQGFAAAPLLTEIAPQNFDPFREWYFAEPISIQHEPLQEIVSEYLAPQVPDPLGEWYFEARVDTFHETLGPTKDFVHPQILDRLPHWDVERVATFDNQPYEGPIFKFIDIQRQNHNPPNEWFPESRVHLIDFLGIPPLIPDVNAFPSVITLNAIFESQITLSATSNASCDLKGEN